MCVCVCLCALCVQPCGGGGTADEEIKVFSAEKLELSPVLSVKPGRRQSIALHASPSARILPSKFTQLFFFFFHFSKSASDLK